MKKYLIFISLFISTILGAQPLTECGTIPSKVQIDYLSKTQAQRGAFSYDYKSSNAIQIPIVNHIVAQSDGSGGLTLQELASAMQTLNDFYAQVNVEFVECEPAHFINNSDWYHFNSSDDINIRNANDIPGVLNIYYFETIHNGDICGYTNFPPGPDRIMMANHCVDGTTLIHEVGHYFSLYHTHGKSNCGTTDELVDQSNCDIAGDDVCDTPADPNLYINCETLLVYNCEYIGTLTDANGQFYNPQVDNIMAYSGDCRDVFTQGQFDRVLFSVLNDRNYLTCNPACTATVTTFPYTEGFETGIEGWTQDTDDDIDWTQHTEGTSSYNTGPSNASQGSSYIYIEATANYNPSRTANFVSPCFDIYSLSSPTLTFDYHMYGEGMGTLTLHISTDDGRTWTNLWTQTGNQGDTWYAANLDLSSYTSDTFILRFNGITGNSFTSDMAIDNLRIQDDNSCPFPAGTVCDDADICTINDVYDDNCNCIGIFQDTDGDGVCDANDPCPTDPDDTCIPIPYCSSQGNSSYEFIESVQIGTITNISGNNNGYGDYTGNIPFDIGNFDTPITLTPGFTRESYDENWKIWVDINKDGDFEDAGEEIFSGTSVGTNPLSGIINAPPADGQTTMRIAMVWNVAATPCSTIEFGEIEDYTVNLSTISGKSAPVPKLIQVYPNPAKQYINVNIHDIISSTNIQSVNALIYNMDGKQLYSQTLNVTSVLTINTQDLPEASYLLRLQTDDGRTFTGKFLKM